MNSKASLTKYSMGIGDRFGKEGPAQLRALQKAASLGVTIAPVWNKSNREHSIIGTQPMDVRREADAAVAACGWEGPYFVDADHIGLGNVDAFLDASDFFTIDIADFIGKPAQDATVAAYVDAMQPFVGTLSIPGIAEPIEITLATIADIAARHLHAIQEAGRVYRRIAAAKSATGFITEVSLDEASAPQTPAELLFIVAGLAREGIAVNTVAPKFTGAFLKGIDYVGDVGRFTQEFADDLAVLRFAVGRFSLPQDLKLSIHSGSDKFSIYPLIREALTKADMGVHLKTAGTTWLEEVIGLAAAGGDGLAFAKALYAEAFGRYEEMAAPYLPVIEIDRARLPRPQSVNAWNSEQFVQALEHNLECPQYSVHFRQLVHISFRVAAERLDVFNVLLDRYRSQIEAHVTQNIFARHVQPLFLGSAQ